MNQVAPATTDSGVVPRSVGDLRLSEDLTRTLADGWTMCAGYPIHSFDQNRFNTQYELYQFLYAQAKIDSWYRNIFNKIPWNYAYDKLAAMQGWAILLYSQQSPFICRYGTRFLSNEEAANFVYKQAELDDPLCAKAVQKLTAIRLKECAM